MESSTKKVKVSKLTRQCSRCELPIGADSQYCFFHELQSEPLQAKKNTSGFGQFGLPRDVIRLIWSKVFDMQSFDDTRDMIQSKNFLPDLIDALEYDQNIWRKWWHEDFFDFAHEIGPDLPDWTTDSSNPWKKYYMHCRFLRVGLTKIVLYCIGSSNVCNPDNMQRVSKYGIADLIKCQSCEVSGDIHYDYALDGTEKWGSIDKNIINFFKGRGPRCSKHNTMIRMFNILKRLRAFNFNKSTRENSKYYLAACLQIGHSTKTLWTFQSMLCWFLASYYQTKSVKIQYLTAEVWEYVGRQNLLDSDGKFGHLLNSQSIPYISKRLKSDPVKIKQK